MISSILIFLIIGSFLLAYNARSGQHQQGLSHSVSILRGVLPVVLVAFLLAGMIEALIPEAFVRHWLATEAGLRGVFFGTLGGAILAMGPYASFPIIASVNNAGAGLGTVIALITAWALFGLNKMPFEIGFFGLRFTVIRIVLSLPLCLGAGALAHMVDIMFF